MSERAYTVREIDELRRACERRWLYGTTASLGDGVHVSRPYRTEDKDKGVEELVRTYMLAGIVAEDIYTEDRGGAALTTSPST